MASTTRAAAAALTIGFVAHECFSVGTATRSLRATGVSAGQNHGTSSSSSSAAGAFGTAAATAAVALAAGHSMARRKTSTAARAEKMSPAVPFLPFRTTLEGFVGAEEEGFDPLGLSAVADMKFLREAEIKHGRIAMLAVVGWAATDLGLRLPGAAYQVSTVQAHNAAVADGVFAHLLVWIGWPEFFGYLALQQSYDGKTDRAPGDFGLRGFYPSDTKGQYEFQLKELRNGRLAMLAIGGLATVGVLTNKQFPGFGLFAEGAAVMKRSGSTLCGVQAKPSVRQVARAAMERSASVPFLTKPKNLGNLAGSEIEFDPLGFSDAFDVKWLRESEIKHGRLSMLACVGFLATTAFTLPGATPEEDSLQAFYHAPPALWAVLIFLAGYAESAGYQGSPVGFGQTQVSKSGGINLTEMFKDTDRQPGDFGFRALYPSDAAGQKQRQLNEVMNGRLAMFAIGGMVHHNLIVKGGFFPIIPDNWAGPYNAWHA